MIPKEQLQLFNTNLRHEDPIETVQFLLSQSKRPMISTSFGPRSAALLHLVTSVKPDIPVVWCDTGFNTEATYKHAVNLTEMLELNLEVFSPERTTAFLRSQLGDPGLDNPNHSELSRLAKLEPFERALSKYQPDCWFSNLRAGQTDHRNLIDILSFHSEGVLKASPFYYYSDAQLDNYMLGNQLPFEPNYFDPIKALSKRECGIHFDR